MAGTALANWQQYSRWLYVIARTFKINKMTAPQLTAADTCIKGFWNMNTMTGTRPWLKQDFERLSGQPRLGGSVTGDPDFEPVFNVVKMLEHIARDIKKIPLTDAEKTLVDAMFAATGTLKYGRNSTDATFGTTI